MKRNRRRLSAGTWGIGRVFLLSAGSGKTPDGNRGECALAEAAGAASSEAWRWWCEAGKTTGGQPATAAGAHWEKWQAGLIQRHDAGAAKRSGWHRRQTGGGDIVFVAQFSVQFALFVIPGANVSSAETASPWDDRTISLSLLLLHFLLMCPVFTHSRCVPVSAPSLHQTVTLTLHRRDVVTADGGGPWSCLSTRVPARKSPCCSLSWLQSELK